MAFCEQAKAAPSALLRLCLDRLHRSPLVPVQFWCLQALHDAILLRYPSLPPADLPLLRSSLLSLAFDHPLLFNLILAPASPEQLRYAAAGCVLAIVSKGMEPHSKLALLRSLRVSQMFADPDLVVRLATLITRYASEALECYKKLDRKPTDSGRVQSCAKTACQNLARPEPGLS